MPAKRVVAHSAELFASHRDLIHTMPVSADESRLGVGESIASIQPLCAYLCVNIDMWKQLCTSRLPTPDLQGPVSRVAALDAINMQNVRMSLVRLQV